MSSTQIKPSDVRDCILSCLETVSAEARYDLLSKYQCAHLELSPLCSPIPESQIYPLMSLLDALEPIHRFSQTNFHAVKNYIDQLCYVEIEDDDIFTGSVVGQ